MIEEAGGASREEESPPFDIIITGCGMWDPDTMPSQGYYAADDSFIGKSSSTTLSDHHDQINQSANSGAGKKSKKGLGNDTVHPPVKKLDKGGKEAIVDKMGKISPNDKAHGAAEIKLKQLEQGFDKLSTISTTGGPNMHSNSKDGGEDDDFFGDQGEGNELSADKKTQNSVANKLYNDGYRNGKVQEEERLFQQGFDTGLKEGIRVGLLVGSSVAKIRHVLKSSSLSDSKLPPDDPLMEYMSGKFVENYHQDKCEAKRMLQDLWASSFPIENSQLSDNEHVGHRSVRDELRKIYEELQEHL